MHKLGLYFDSQVSRQLFKLRFSESVGKKLKV